MDYKFAITSSDGYNIDTHFGQADGFYIFEANEEHGQYKFIEFRKIDITKETGAPAALENSCNGHDASRLACISTLLKDCQYLFTRKIGLKPYRFLQREGLTSLELSGNLAPIVEKINLYRLNYSVKGWSV